MRCVYDSVGYFVVQKSIVTLGPIGYLPAPGTMASLATIPLVLIANAYLSPTLYLLFCGVIFFLGIFIIQKLRFSFDLSKDPSHIVIDEVAGCMITFACVPITAKTLIFGFVLFRLLDIFKLGLIKKCEELPGAWGIMVDDLVAGLLANVIMQIVLGL